MSSEFPRPESAAGPGRHHGQDLDEGSDGVFRVARRVARDRVVSTVDPEARHGHKTSARGFDGYKDHIAIDPDSELITATGVTAGNAGDVGAAADLLAGDLPAAPDGQRSPARRMEMARLPARARIRCLSTGMPLTAPASCSMSWSGPAPTSSARSSRRWPRAAGSPRTRSASTWTPAG